MPVHVALDGPARLAARRKAQVGMILMNNGISMPRIGLGVFRTAGGDETRASVMSALQLGYRHIDTATIYGNEADVGIAVRQSGVRREELFITTKLWNKDQGYDSALRAFEASRVALGLEAIDLYLLHWPVTELRLESWRALEKLYESGQVRAIGVSNFMVRHLEELQAHAHVPPAINQIEIHPFFQQREVRAWCADNKIAVSAYSPLAKAAALSDPVVTRVAAEAGITPAQALLAWGLQQGHVVLPKSIRPARQAENLASAGITLSAEHLSTLNELERGQTTGWDPRSTP